MTMPLPESYYIQKLIQAQLIIIDLECSARLLLEEVTRLTEDVKKLNEVRQHDIENQVLAINAFTFNTLS